jgi:hypothetical protein
VAKFVPGGRRYAQALQVIAENADIVSQLTGLASGGIKATMLPEEISQYQAYMDHLVDDALIARVAQASGYYPSLITWAEGMDKRTYTFE